MKGKAGRFSRRAPFSPATLSGLTGWWDASDSSTLFDATTGGSAVAADGEVARLADKSGNGRHFTQSSSSFRPLRKTAIKSGLDVVRFDGTNDAMAADGFIYSDVQSSTASSIFLVAIAQTVDTNFSVFNNAMLFTEAGGSHGVFALASDDTATAYGTDVSNAIKEASVSYVPGNWVVFSSWHDGSTINAQKNEDASVSAAMSTKSFTSSAPRLGSNAFQDNFFDGDLGELITYNVALSAVDRGKVISYLMDKWGI